MKRLILHIGTHKTGSSAIQEWLSKQTNSLRGHGVHYGCTDRAPFPEVPAHTSLFWSLVRPDLDFESERDAVLSDFRKSDCDTLILSNEGLSQNTPKALAQIETLASDFEITTVCFLRRQDRFLESWWNQRCKEGLEARPIVEFVQTQESKRRTQYVEMLRFWARFSTVRAVNYDAIRSRGTVSAFADICGLSHDGTNEAVHVSPSMNCAALCNYLNRKSVRYDPEKLNFLLRNDKGSVALGSRLRKEILAANAEANMRLAKEFGVHFDDQMPAEADVPLTCPSIRALLKALFRGMIPRRERSRLESNS